MAAGIAAVLLFTIAVSMRARVDAADEGGTARTDLWPFVLRVR